MNHRTPPYYSWLAMATVLGFGATPSMSHGQQVVPNIGVAPHQQPAHPLDSALRTARASLQNIQANVGDYSALFVKRFRVDGELSEMQYANIKIRNRKTKDGKITTPMAVYLDFLEPDLVKGREVLWVEGKNNGKLIAHDMGFRSFLNVQLDPTGYVAMRGQRYPITEIGIEKLVLKMIEKVERDRQHGECQVRIRNASVNGTACTLLQVIHPVKRDHFDFHCAQLYFDKKLNLPIRYVSWSWPVKPGEKPVLEEEYTYLHMKVNVGLTDRDFDIGNSEYRFR
jgi:hypothetical protein